MNKNNEYYKYFGYSVVLLTLALLISGCAAKLKWLDQKVGEGLKQIEKNQDRPMDKENSEDSFGQIKELTKEQKQKIDSWIEENNLNRYGDPADTMYIGGTPLFNEATGENIDRYDYILGKHSDLLEKID